MEQFMSAIGALKQYEFIVVNNHDNLVSDLIKLQPKIDFAFNVCDEGFGNDASKELHIPALLEILGIPYTGAGPQCLALCYDKSFVRGVAKEMRIAVADAAFICPGDESFDLSFGFPAIVKPNVGDSSYGITKENVVQNYSQLKNIISILRKQFGADLPILVEKFLPGADLSVGLVGNVSSGFVLSSVSEEDYSKLPSGLPKICGYEAKWLYDSVYNVLKSIPAKIPEHTRQKLIKDSIQLFQRLDCRDYCRIDWRLDENGDPKLLEVNPNPGLCWDGHLTKMASFYNISFSGLLDMLFKVAEERIFSKPSSNNNVKCQPSNDSEAEKKIENFDTST